MLGRGRTRGDREPARPADSAVAAHRRVAHRCASRASFEARALHSRLVPAHRSPDSARHGGRGRRRGRLLLRALGRGSRPRDSPVWEPLIEAVGERLVGTFMWMYEEEMADGTILHVYKRVHTRRYMHLRHRRACVRLHPVCHAPGGWTLSPCQHRGGPMQLVDPERVGRRGRCGGARRRVSRLRAGDPRAHQQTSQQPAGGLSGLSPLRYIMDAVSIHEAKTQFSRLVARAEAGEEIVVRRGPTPVAKIVATAPHNAARSRRVEGPDHDRRGLRRDAGRVRRVQRVSRCSSTPMRCCGG